MSRAKAFVVAAFVALLATGGSLLAQGPAGKQTKEFPQGAATSSEECGACHQAIYREYATGFGGDINYKEMIYKTKGDNILTMPAATSATPTAHAGARTDPFPVHARDVEAGGKSCNVCHFPKAFNLPDMETLEIGRPEPKPVGEETGGVTCASCHLTPEGKIRAPHDVSAIAPHATVVEPRIHTAVMCAYCHAKGKRVPGMQTNTFYEWREDFHKAELGSQQCQDCHMPRTTRKVAEDFDVPPRAVSRHLWTGGHSEKRVAGALNVTIVQPTAGKNAFEFHVINIGAGHSAPSGSNRRGIYLQAQAVDKAGKVLAEKQWMFAPWYADRPDDKAFLEADKALPDATSAMQADAQGPHEAPVRAGEDRVLAWEPAVKGNYTVKAKLVYDLNRYNDITFTGDQTVFQDVALKLK